MPVTDCRHQSHLGRIVGMTYFIYIMEIKLLANI